MAHNSLGPPPYYELFTDAARDDPAHVDHALFTPPPPIEGTFLKFHDMWTSSHQNLTLDPNVRRLFTLPNATAVAAAGSVAAALARDALSGADDGRAATSETVAEAGPGVFAHQVAAMNTAVTDNFLNLLKVVSAPAPTLEVPPGVPPPRTGEALHELWSALNNMAVLLSLARRAQARAGVVALTQAQNARMRAKARGLERAAREARALLKQHGVLSSDDDDDEDGNKSDGEAAHEDEVEQSVGGGACSNGSSNTATTDAPSGATAPAPVPAAAPGTAATSAASAEKEEDDEWE